jgi:hypothetical protein
MSRSWNLYLEDILEAIRKIEVYTRDLDFLGFCQDERTVDAVIRNLILSYKIFFSSTELSRLPRDRVLML